MTDPNLENEVENKIETDNLSDEQARRPTWARRLSSALVRQWTRKFRPKSPSTLDETNKNRTTTSKDHCHFDPFTCRLVPTVPPPKPSTSLRLRQVIYNRIRPSFLRGGSRSTRPSSRASTATQPFPEYTELAPQESFAGTIPYAARQLEVVDWVSTNYNRLDHENHDAERIGTSSVRDRSARVESSSDPPPHMSAGQILDVGHSLEAGPGSDDHKAVHRRGKSRAARHSSHTSTAIQPFPEYTLGTPRPSFAGTVRGWKHHHQSDRQHGDPEVSITKNPDSAIAMRNRGSPVKRSPAPQPAITSSHASATTEPLPEYTDMMPQESFTGTGRGWNQSGRAGGDPKLTNEENLDPAVWLQNRHGSVRAEPPHPRLPSPGLTPSIEETPSVGDTPSIGNVPNVDAIQNVDDTLSVGETPSHAETQSINQSPNMYGSPSVNGSPSDAGTPSDDNGDLTHDEYEMRVMRERRDWERRRAHYLAEHGEDAHFPAPPKPPRINERQAPGLFDRNGGNGW